MKEETYTETSLSPDSASRNRGFIQSRLQNFGLTLVVMGASFALYYLGLFGTQEGPLNPARMGTALNGFGFTSRDFVAVLVVLLFLSVVWNHLYNLLCRLRGRRMTCIAEKGLAKKICGAPARRQAKAYVCPHGHSRNQACFHPLRKGIWAHCLWIACALFVLIALKSL
jgi:hypothetical protein